MDADEKAGKTTDVADNTSNKRSSDEAKSEEPKSDPDSDSTIGAVRDEALPATETVAPQKVCLYYSKLKF